MVSLRSVTVKFSHDQEHQTHRGVHVVDQLFFLFVFFFILMIKFVLGAHQYEISCVAPAGL